MTKEGLQYVLTVVVYIICDRADERNIDKENF